MVLVGAAVVMLVLSSECVFVRCLKRPPRPELPSSPRCAQVCIDPMAPPTRQQVEDMPPVGEGVPLARALLELLPSMGGNALVAHRALRMLSAAGAPGCPCCC